MHLYGPPNAGNPRRVTIFLAEKRVQIPWRPVDMAAFEHKREPYLTKNPSGRVPVLELDDGVCISETIAICRYIETYHPDPPLFGCGPLEQAIVEMWQRRVELEIFIPSSHYLRHTDPALKHFEPVQIPEWGMICKERVEAGLRIADRQLARHEYLTGSRFTVADITLAHQLLGFPGETGVRIPDDCHHLERWLEQVYERPSIKGTQPQNFGLIQKVRQKEIGRTN